MARHRRESGSGKSTLVKLLMRYWDPDGQVKLNNNELPKITESSLHRLEGVMEQRTFLFEDTLGNNIRLGKKDATLEEVKEAAEKLLSILGLKLCQKDMRQSLVDNHEIYQMENANGLV